MSTNDETAIRAIIDARAKAVGAGDVAALMADVADDIVNFDVVDPLRRVGIASSRERAKEWLTTYAGPINWENRDLRVAVGGDVAFCHCLSRPLYWLTDTAASSARMYSEHADIGKKNNAGVVDIPVGCSVFPREIFPAPRSWANRVYPKLIYWNEVDRGGHFAAFEEPMLFAQELRAFARKVR